MNNLNARATLFWTSLVDSLDIPLSLYKKAADRHKSLGEWFCRPGSQLEGFGPRVRPQGSFRYGTVVRPIIEDAEYDLDHVVVLERLSPGAVTQAELKRLHGIELRAYAAAHGMLAPEEHNRCWRAKYRDEVAFHIDSVPSLLAGPALAGELRRAGVEESMALRVIAITDRRHPMFSVLDPNWPTSNPRGFARWFEAQAARGRDQRVLEGLRATAVEDIPPYEWKTPLQRAIQILKRHRDVMFQQAPEIAPISMIITNLAAHAYQGERDLTDTLRGIVTRMPNFVRSGKPRVPNPTHPAEDYDDKWNRDARLEGAFWEWHQQACVDVEHLSSPLTRFDPKQLVGKFRFELTKELEARLAVGAPAVAASHAAVSTIASAPRPWAG
jgi:hypothetical protein